MRFLCISLLVAGIFWKAAACADEITLLYTGETHAMLYPCNCPIEPDGGITRRASLVKELRVKYPGALLLDSGGFFAGGLMDEHTQSAPLDMARTEVNLKGLALMRYDALALGDDELNFGREYFEARVRDSGLSVLSCNAGGLAGSVKPYLIKTVGTTKVGIIGVTGVFAGQKAGGSAVGDPRAATAAAAAELKRQGVGVLVLLSHLGEAEDRLILSAVPDIDVIITGHSRGSDDPFSRVGNTLILRPAWQGRRLGKAVLTFQNGVITKSEVTETRLSDKVPPDEEVLRILPACFADADCKKGDLPGTCSSPGAPDAQCVYSAPAKVKMLIISHKDCFTCDLSQVVDGMKKQFPGLTVSQLESSDRKAKELMRDFAVMGLPVFFIGKEADREQNFALLKEKVVLKGDWYMLKPEVTGLAFFPGRTKVKGKFDLMMSLYDNNAPAILEAANDLNPDVHFLVVEKGDGFEANNGRREVEECLRAVCVQQYYPRSFRPYLQCRASSIDSAWWDDCVTGLDTAKIKACAQGDEGRRLLRENIGITRDLRVMFGPAYLVDNQEIFGSQGVPSKEELRKIIKRTKE